MEDGQNVRSPLALAPCLPGIAGSWVGRFRYHFQRLRSSPFHDLSSPIAHFPLMQIDRLNPVTRIPYY